MTNKEFKRIIKDLDKSKYELFRNGITFHISAKNKRNGEFYNIGIGDGVDMSMLSLINLCDLYDNRHEKSVTIEQFADSVAANLKQYYKDWCKEVNRTRN